MSIPEENAYDLADVTFNCLICENTIRFYCFDHLTPRMMVNGKRYELRFFFCQQCAKDENSEHSMRIYIVAED